MADQTSGGALSPWLKTQRLKKVSTYAHGRVLDYGCGTGDLLEYCRPASYFGYDPDRQSVEIARVRYPGYEFSSDHSVLQKAGHVESPHATLAALKQLLAPQGRFVLTTPHPHWRIAHDFGARLGIFNREASREHKSFLDRPKIFLLGRDLELKVLHFEEFLLGANQLIILGFE
jgi:SAM-dependent methyltransferase